MDAHHHPPMNNAHTLAWLLCQPPEFEHLATGAIQLGDLFIGGDKTPLYPRSINGFYDNIMPPVPEGSHEDFFDPVVVYKTNRERMLLEDHGQFLPLVCQAFGDAGLPEVAPVTRYVIARDVRSTIFRLNVAGHVRALQENTIESILRSQQPRPIYMITGLMIASQATIVNMHRIQNADDPAPAIDWAAAGVPPHVAAELILAMSETDEIRVERRTDFVLAYRCSRVVFNQQGYWAEVTTMLNSPTYRNSSAAFVRPSDFCTWEDLVTPVHEWIDRGWHGREDAGRQDRPIHVLFDCRVRGHNIVPLQEPEIYV